MSRLIAKLFVLVGSFFLPLICTLLPYKVSGYISRKGAFGKRLLSYLMCLGGGIFFGTYLLHMGPEVQTIMKESLLDPYGITYPVAELMVGVGFFIVLFAEKIVLRWSKRRNRRKRERCEGNRSSGDNEKMRGQKRVDDVHQNADNHESRSTHADAISRLLTLPDVDVDSSECTTAATGSGSPTSHESATTDPHPDLSQKENHTKADGGLKKSPSKEFDVETCSAGTPGGHHHVTRSFILMLALSLHRIFEGMGIGLQQTTTNVVSLFGAVMCHETVIGFSLGLQFVRAGFVLRRILTASIVCSTIMPLGVLIGIVMTEIESGGGNVDIANGLLQAVAMGTFIYVTFFEILQEEVDADDTSLGKIVCIAVGFAIMALLILIPEGDIGTTPTSTSNLNASTVVPCY